MCSIAKHHPSCYNQHDTRITWKGVDLVVQTLEVFWQLFQVTGSVSAYLMYSKLK